MIIACPECTSPFQVLDDQIAALVQIECPTCSFRMILDFAAANDAALREDGMRFAQGFFDEATYRQAVGAEVSYASASPRAPAGPELHAVPEPQPEPESTLEPEFEPEPEPPVAEPVRRPSFTPAPTPQPVQPAQQPIQPQAEPARAKPPVRARPTLIAHTAPPPVRQPTDLLPPTGTPSAGTQLEPPADTYLPDPRGEAAIDTHVGPPPQAEVAASHTSTGADDAQLEVSSDEFSVDLDEPEYEPEPRTPARPRPVEQAEPQLRTPPHSPAQPTATKPTPDEPEPELPAIETKRPEKVEQTGKKGGALKTAFLMLLLLILIGAAGLMGWSVIETQDPNPLPMLKNKFGIDLGFGVPAEPDAQPSAQPPASGQAGSDKSGGQ